MLQFRSVLQPKSISAMF
uniref:Uncharacterized protein n=1 Tax=Arundo donax TaxID=35708 RepID=A0A0A8ZFM8_ARUDO